LGDWLGFGILRHPGRLTSSCAVGIGSGCLDGLIGLKSVFEEVVGVCLVLE